MVLPEPCQICGGIARRFHYSAWVCASCASFFRRSVILKRHYICLQTYCKDWANVSPCKACRLKKCISAGMKIESVLLRKLPTPLDQFKESDLLTKIVKSRNAIYIHKMSVLTKLAEQKNQTLEMGVLNGGKERLEMSRVSEFHCLMSYLKDSELILDLDRSETIFLAQHLFYKWLFYSEVFATLRHDGHKRGVVYLTDCIQVPLTIKDTMEFVGKQELKNAPELARFYFEMSNRGMKVACRFNDYRLDPNEWAFFLHLLVMIQAKELFPENKSVKKRINKLFIEIRKYLLQNYKQFEVRFGNMLLLLYEVNAVNAEYHMLGQILAMSGYTSVIPKLISNYRDEYKLPEL